MARLQILELPEGSNDDRPPFVLVVDEWDVDTLDAHAALTDYWDAFGKKIGARGVLFADRRIDIPANDTSAYLRDDTRWSSPDELRAQIQEEIAKAHAETINTLNENGPITADEQKAQPSTKPRRDWCCSLAFQTLGQQHIDDCRQASPQP